jgi:hypothetical protein
MLPDFIIEQIRRREEAERRRREERQPRLELPLDVIPPARHRPDDDDRDRGVIVVDLRGSGAS